MSTFLLSKSSDNENAANRLLAAKLYAPVVHSAYYACVLLMLDIMTTEFGQTDIQIDTAAQDSGLGTHNWLIQAFRTHLYSKNNALIPDFIAFITRLKKNRKKSDYQNLNISEKIAKQSVADLAQLKQILTQNFRTS